MSLNYRQKAVRKGNGQHTDQTKRKQTRDLLQDNRPPQNPNRHPLFNIRDAVEVLADYHIRADTAASGKYLVCDELTALDPERYPPYEQDSRGVQWLADALHYDDSGGDT